MSKATVKKLHWRSKVQNVCLDSSTFTTFFVIKVCLRVVCRCRKALSHWAALEAQENWALLLEAEPTMASSPSLLQPLGVGPQWVISS